MAKRRNKQKIGNLITMLVVILTAAVALIGLACNMISITSAGKLTGVKSTENWNLSNWFENINDMKDVTDIANWQAARILLIISAILLVVMLVMLVVKYFVKHPAVKWVAFMVSIAAAVCGAIFMVLTIIGCSALSGTILTVEVAYRAHVGVYLFAISAAVSGISGAIVALSK